ncbi:hypothetical protein KHV-MN_00167 [Cyprinid herpesvirus 3]|nr:hypothetical protein KHV-MN_00001 [Cyprinid herpesvirus 3]QQZ02246.1 hypothetical protein KHV-MN_00167 [Cyprinid herpesvirus 3]
MVDTSNPTWSIKTHQNLYKNSRFYSNLPSQALTGLNPTTSSPNSAQPYHF